MAMLPVLPLAGCTASLPDGERLKRFTEVIRGYDETLTEAEKETAISELQQDKERQDQQTGKSEPGPKTD